LGGVPEPKTKGRGVAPDFASRFGGIKATGRRRRLHFAVDAAACLSQRQQPGGRT